MSASKTPRTIRARRLFLVSSLAASLVACGGGGGGGDRPAPNPGAPAPAPAPTPNAPAVAAGNGYSLVLKTDGGIASWGDQQTGQLGNGVTSGSSQRVPQTVLGLNNARQVAAGEFHAVALRADGTVAAWGSNVDGKLGIASAGGLFATPQTVSGLSNVRAIAVGADHALALRNDGTVWAWGMNDEGQLGLGTSVAFAAAPTQVPGLTDVQSIAAGGAHSFAIRADGSVWGWGWNAAGQLGLGAAAAARINSPTRITLLDGRDVVEIVGGYAHTLARTRLGALLGWGSNSHGQTGVAPPSPVNVLSPTVIPNLLGVTKVAAGTTHSIALRDDGTVRTWGNAGAGRLGNGTSGATQSTHVPQVVNLSNAIAVAAGNDHSLVALTDGRVMCFGSNFLSQCGVLGTNLEFATPVEVGPGFRTGG